jgi:hypothetical protein
MALNYHTDLTGEYKQNVYSITLDMSGWQKTTIQVEAPVAAPLFVYGSNDASAIQGVRDGDASTARNFVQLATLNVGTTTPATLVSSISSAGAYEVDINARFLRVQGGGANVYKIMFNHYK